ncbi:hypothetical protein ACWEQ7_05275 [Streptomyces sp. NPDC004069]
MSKGLTKFELRASRTALTWTGLVLGLLACVLVSALRLGLLFIRSDSWPAYVPPPPTAPAAPPEPT